MALRANVSPFPLIDVGIGFTAYVVFLFHFLLPATMEPGCWYAVGWLRL